MSELFKNKYRTKSNRFESWDYSNSAWYYVTLCTRNKECFFGDISDGMTHLSDIGLIADECWLKIPKQYPNVSLDYFIIMPNHIHGIINFKETTHGSGDAIYRVFSAHRYSETR